MKTEKNLAKVFAMALRGAAKEIRELGALSQLSQTETRDNALASIESVAEELEKYSAIGDAHDWQESYELLRDAIAEHLDAFIEEDDVAEEAMYAAAIRRVGDELEKDAPPRPPNYDLGVAAYRARSASWALEHFHSADHVETLVEDVVDAAVGSPDPAGGAR